MIDVMLHEHSTTEIWYKHYSDKTYFNSLLDPSDTKSLEVILEAVEAAEATKKEKEHKKEN